MLMCYGKEVSSLDLIKTKQGDVRALVRFGSGDKAHNVIRALVRLGSGDKAHDVSCESISWQSHDWNKK